MDQVHEPVIKQCIASMALNNNVLKHNPCDSFCLIKNDQPLNQQNSKTVSLVLTRLTNTPNTYVHVLRCNSCDFMTLNTSNLKEHVKNKHPTSLGFSTYTCNQCSSVSTERSLMEEHLRIYHRVTDNVAGKLIEKFHAPTSDLIGLTAPSINNSLPITLTTTSSISGSNNLAVNLVNAIAAIQNAGRTQSQQGIANVTFPIATSSATATTFSIPTRVTSPDQLKLEDRTIITEESAHDDPTPTTDVSLTTNVNPALNVSGSRRRKATNPGRICTQTAKLVNQDPLDDGKLSPNKCIKNDSSKIESTAENLNSSSIKRSSSCEGINILCELDTNLVNPPSPKRHCNEDLTKPDEPNPNGSSDSGLIRSPVKSNAPSLVLSFGNSISELNTTVGGVTRVSPSTATFCSTQLPTVGTYSPGGPFLGQLIPLSGLPENLLSSISAALLQSQQTNSTINSAINNSATSIPVPILDSHTETPSTTTSAWVLTNPANSLTLNLNQPQTSLTAIQPTLLVPVPTALNDSPLTSSLKQTSQSQDSLPTPAQTTSCTGVLRLPDLLEALKYVTGGGNLISSFSMPSTPLTIRPSSVPSLSSVSTQVIGQTTTTTSSNQNSRIDGFSLQTIPNSGAGTLASLVAHLASTTNSQILSSPLGTFSQVHSSNNILNSGTPVTCAPVVTSNQDLSSAISTTASKSSSTIQKSEETVMTSTGSLGNENISDHTNSTGLDQALDMSVRSTGTSQSIPTRTIFSKSEEYPGISDSSVLSNAGGVTEVLNAALKGGFKQRLIQSIEVPVSSLLANPAHCLTAIANSISNLQNSSETSGTTDSLLGRTINTNESGSSNFLLKKQLSNPTSTTVTMSSPSAVIANSETPDTPRSDIKMESPTTTQTPDTNNNNNNTVTYQPLASSGVLNVAQLQAIMAALANASTVSISLPVSSALSTAVPTPSTQFYSTSASTLSSPHMLSMSCQPNSLTTSSSPSSTVNINSCNPLACTTTTTTMPGLETGTATLLPTLNNLTNVCGLTLAGLSSLPSNVATLASPISTNIASINPGLKGITVPPGECISLTGILSGNVPNIQSSSGHFGSTIVGNPALINFISASRSPTQSNVTLGPATAARLLTNLATSTSVANLFPIINNGITGSTGNLCNNTVLGTANIQNGAINLLDPQHALLAAAASAVQNLQRPTGQSNTTVSQIALANLKTPMLNSTTGRQTGTSTPVIGLLDPRTSLQLRVADSSTASPTILTSTHLTNCLNNGQTQIQEVDQCETTTDRNDWNSNEYTKRRKVLDTSANKTPELEHNSPFRSQVDEDWDVDTDDANNRTGHPSIYPRRADVGATPTTDTELPIQLDSPSTTNYSSQSSSLLGSSSKRSLGMHRSGSGRRNLHNLGDHGQQLRPHRQNFTPNQNRILTEWYQLHQAKPYPSTDDTKELATISGLSYSQVKKWFANKRARSTSNGLPKPTPPLAPDSSTDPSAAAAIVAAAMAAATSATMGANRSDTDTHSLQSYLLSPHTLESLTSISLNNQIDLQNSSLKDTKEESDIEFNKSCDSFDNVTKEGTYLSGDSMEKVNTENTDEETASVDSRIRDKDRGLNDLDDNLDDAMKYDVDSALIIDSEIPEDRASPDKLINGDNGPYFPSSPPTLEVHINPRVNSPYSFPDTTTTDDIVMLEETKSSHNDTSLEVSDTQQQQELNTSDEATESINSLSSAVGLQKNKCVPNGPITLEAR